MTTETLVPDTLTPENAAPSSPPDAALTHEVAYSAGGHFQLHLSRLISRIVGSVCQSLPPDETESLLEQYPFVDGYRRQLAHLPFDNWLVQFEAEYFGHLPLRALREQLAVTGRSLDLLLAAGLIEEDIRFGSLFAALQDPLPTRAPCLGILSWLLGPEEDGEQPIWRAAEELVRQGLLLIQRGEGAVRLEWTVRVPMPVWDAMHGLRLERPSERITLQTSTVFPDLADLILPAGLHERIRRVPAMVAQGELNTLVLRGMTGAGRRTTLGAIAKALGRDVLLCESETLSEDERKLLGPLATLTHALPVLRLAAGAGETLPVERLPGFDGTLGVAMSRIGGLDGPAMENALTLTLPPPARAQRAQFWQASGLPLCADQTAAVADSFLLTGGRILRVGRLAYNRMRLDGRDEAVPDDIRAAMRAVNRQALETLATPLPSVPGWSSLVVVDRLAEELEVLEARCSRPRALDGACRPGFRPQP